MAKHYLKKIENPPGHFVTIKTIDTFKIMVHPKATSRLQRELVNQNGYTKSPMPKSCSTPTTNCKRKGDVGE